MRNVLLRGLDRSEIRRVVALLVFLGLPILFVAVAVTTLVHSLAQSDETEAKADTLAQMQTQVKARLSGRAALRDITPIYLASPSVSVARAQLLSLVGRLIEAADGRLVETQMLSDQGAEPSELIALQTTLDIGNDGLADLLHAVETGLPVLCVHDITVARAPRQERSGPTLLRVTLVVHGYWRTKPT